MREVTNIEKSLQALSQLIGFSAKYGYKSQLADWLDIKSNLISTWIRRGKISKKQLKIICERGFPKEKWLLNNYDLDDTSGILSHDSDHGSYGLPDLSAHRVVKVIEAEDDRFAKAVSGLREIFNSTDPILIPAIEANIIAFQVSVRRDQEIKNMRKEIDDLKIRNKTLEDRLTALEKKDGCGSSLPNREKIVVGSSDHFQKKLS